MNGKHFIQLALVIALGLSAMPVLAQDAHEAPRACLNPALRSGWEAVTGVLDAASLDAMSDAWWKALRTEHLKALASPEPEVRAQAMQNIIFLARYHGHRISFRCVAPVLFQIFQRDEVECLRLMAVSAIVAVGDEATIRQLATVLHREESERVQHAARTALANNYETLVAEN